MAPTGTTTADDGDATTFNAAELELRNFIGRIAGATRAGDETADISMIRTGGQAPEDLSTDSLEEVYPEIEVEIEDFATVTVTPHIKRTDDGIEFFGYRTILKVRESRSNWFDTFEQETFGYDDLERALSDEYSVYVTTQSTVAFSRAVDLLEETMSELRNYRQTIV